MAFNPNEARDEHGRWSKTAAIKKLAEIAKGLKTGQGEEVGAGTGVKVKAVTSKGGGKTTRQFEVVKPGSGPSTSYKTAEEAASAALNHSAVQEHPNALGGERKLNGVSHAERVLDPSKNETPHDLRKDPDVGDMATELTDKYPAFKQKSALQAIINNADRRGDKKRASAARDLQDRLGWGGGAGQKSESKKGFVVQGKDYGTREAALKAGVIGDGDKPKGVPANETIEQYRARRRKERRLARKEKSNAAVKQGEAGAGKVFEKGTKVKTKDGLTGTVTGHAEKSGKTYNRVKYDKNDLGASSGLHHGDQLTEHKGEPAAKKEKGPKHTLSGVRSALGAHSKSTSHTTSVKGYHNITSGWEVNHGPDGSIVVSHHVGQIMSKEGHEKSMKQGLDRYEQALKDKGFTVERKGNALVIPGDAAHHEQVRSKVDALEKEIAYDDREIARIQKSMSQPGVSASTAAYYRKQQQKYRNHKLKADLRLGTLKEALPKDKPATKTPDDKEKGSGKDVGGSSAGIAHDLKKGGKEMLTPEKVKTLKAGDIIRDDRFDTPYDMTVHHVDDQGRVVVHNPDAGKKLTNSNKQKSFLRYKADSKYLKGSHIIRKGSSDGSGLPEGVSLNKFGAGRQIMADGKVIGFVEKQGTGYRAEHRHASNGSPKFASSPEAAVSALLGEEPSGATGSKSEPPEVRKALDHIDAAENFTQEGFTHHNNDDPQLGAQANQQAVNEMNAARDTLHDEHPAQRHLANAITQLYTPGATEKHLGGARKVLKQHADLEAGKTVTMGNASVQKQGHEYHITHPGGSVVHSTPHGALNAAHALSKANAPTKSKTQPKK